MIAQRLRALREIQGRDQAEVADSLKLNRVTYNRYETGAREPDLITVARLAEYYGVSVDYLLGLTDSPNPYKSPKIISDLREGRVAYKDLSEETKKSLNRMDELPIELQDKINEMISTLLDIEKKNKKSN